MSKKIFSLVFIAIILTFILQVIGTSTFASSKLSYSEFLEKVDNGEVDSVEIGSDYLNVKLVDDNQKYQVAAVENDQLVEKLYKAGIDFKQTNNSSIILIISNILLSWGPTLLFVFVFLKVMGKQIGGVLNSGKVKDVSVDKNTGITFKDVAGQDEAKEQLAEIIDYLENPSKYKTIGAKLPKGALLVGPPGTGKTLIAKAVAGEAKVPFFQMSGSDFIEMYAGVGASRVRDLFEKAEKQAPCIIFIDEVDTIAKNRNAGYAGGNDEREQTLNQLLSEIDGFDSSKGIVVLAATNRPEVLDKAFLRTGRFDRKIIVDKPDYQGRLDTFKVHANNIKLAPNADLSLLAKATVGAVGADIANIINEAALRAIKFGRKEVTQEDLMDSIETVFAGKEKKTHLMSKREKEIVAYHEVGHAVVSTIQKGKNPVTKITIVPRTMGALGFTMQVPEEDKYLLSKDEILAEVTTLLAGRASEEIFFGSVTTGASNDIQRATEEVRKMVTMYGMSSSLGLTSFETSKSAFLDDSVVRDCSEQTSATIDKEIIAIINSRYAYAKELILSNKQMVEEIALYLLQRESISGEEFIDIYNRFSIQKKEAPPVPKIETVEETIAPEPVIISVENENKETETSNKKKSENVFSSYNFEESKERRTPYIDKLGLTKKTKDASPTITPEPVEVKQEKPQQKKQSLFTPQPKKETSKEKPKEKKKEKDQKTIFGPQQKTKKSDSIINSDSDFTEDMY